MSEPKIYPDPPPLDRMAVGVRAFFGALLGVVLAFGFWVRLGGFGMWGTLAEFFGVMAFCVSAAVKYGDSFWESLRTRGWPWDWL